MTTILITFTPTKVLRFEIFEESEKETAWKEFKKELKAAPSEVEVRIMTEDEFIKLMK